MSKKPTNKDVTARTIVREAVGMAFQTNARPTPDAIDIIADQSGEELRSLGDSLHVQRNLLMDRRAMVQHVVNTLDGQIEVLDRAIKLIKAE